MIIEHHLNTFKVEQGFSTLTTHINFLTDLNYSVVQFLLEIVE